MNTDFALNPSLVGDIPAGRVIITTQTLNESVSAEDYISLQFYSRDLTEENENLNVFFYASLGFNGSVIFCRRKEMRFHFG